MIKPSCNKQFNLNHENPEIFITSQWQRDKTKANVKYLIYRIIVALLFFSTWILSMFDLKKTDADAAFYAKWLIYLTNWGYTSCTVQAVVAAGMLAASLLATRLRSMPNLKKNALKLYKFYWVLNTIATPIAFGITSMYWGIIYDGKTMRFNASNFFVHANNTIMMMVDLWIVSHPIRFFHLIYPMIFGITYAIFSVIYYFAGGTSREDTTYIYTILRWDKPGSTILVCLGVLAFLVVLHILVWALSNLRAYLYDKFVARQNENNNNQNSNSNEKDKDDKGYDNQAISHFDVI